MNLFLSILIIAAVVGAAIAAMLLVRRFVAPYGGFFSNSERASGVFGVIGTGFAVLLAFVIFLAFSGFDRAREQSGVEAVALTQLFRIAKLFPATSEPELRGDLICYGRAVIHDEWRTMRDGRESPLVDSWILRIEATVDGVRPQGVTQDAAYRHWFDESALRREGRRGRLAQSQPLIPSLVWLVLILGGVMLIVYVCFYADPAERWFVQALMMGGVATAVVAGLLVVQFLDHPYENTSGSIKPREMTISLRAMESEAGSEGTRIPRLCDERGRS